VTCDRLHMSRQNLITENNCSEIGDLEVRRLVDYRGAGWRH
jgi:hypothetical protein